MPQHQITDADDSPDAVDLPELTDKQRRFVDAVIAGKTGADAVRIATDTSAWSQEAIWAEATKLRNNPSVRLWLAAARKSCLGASSLTLQGHLDELERIKEIALEKGNIGAAVAAEQSRGKAVGLYVEQHRDVTEHDPVATLNEIARTAGADTAERLARENNIPWSRQDADTAAGTRH